MNKDIPNPLLSFSRTALEEMDKQAATLFAEATARFEESMKLAKTLREQAMTIVRAQLDAAERFGRAAAAQAQAAAETVAQATAPASAPSSTKAGAAS